MTDFTGWTALEIKEALSTISNIPDSIQINRFVIDSREVTKGDCFIALAGEVNDGHDYLADVAANGAVIAIVEVVNEAVDIPQVKISDCYKALHLLASYRRQKVSSKVISITGSVGKTTLKDAIYFLLDKAGKSYKTFGNFNNHIGTPLCVANMPLDTEYAVFELGMNSPGEIGILSKLVKPDIAIITLIADAHIGNFSGQEDIAKEKLEICAGLASEGSLILNSDSDCYEYLIKGAIDKYRVKEEMIYSFGSKEDVLVILEGQDIYNFGIKQKYKLADREYEMQLKFFNKELAKLFLILPTLLELLKIDVDNVKNISEFQLTKGRGRIDKVSFFNKDITLIDDSYNASPISMVAAINTLGALPGYKRKVAVIGDMLELGADAMEYHLGLAEVLKENKIDKVITLGKYASSLFDALPADMQLHSFLKIDELSTRIVDLLEDGDVVLIKSSHGTKTYQIAEQLLNLKD
jgi:UDP-N-acetylmuramoyl-tripeptide--D-alanyl-D-alanine ligase